MRKLLFILVSFFLLASCTTQKPLYSWEKYETTSYNYLKNQDDQSLQELIENYDKMIRRQRGVRKVVPPGIYADYGFVLIKANKTKQGKEMLKKELALYPESKVYVYRILKMIDE
jgi:hypothetical protein